MSGLDGFSLTFPDDRVIREYDWIRLNEAVRTHERNIRQFEQEILKQRAEIQRIEGIMERKKELDAEDEERRDGRASPV